MNYVNLIYYNIGYISVSINVSANTDTCLDI